jgi:hypothetical protein
MGQLDLCIIPILNYTLPSAKSQDMYYVRSDFWNYEIIN